MTRALFVFLSFISSSAFSHPGHGALEVHWHLDDIVLAALGAVALIGIVFLVRKVLKR